MASASVSVMIPVRDGERFLAEAIQSVLDQTLPPGEVIVVDDGSTDGSAAVAESFGPPVRTLRLPPAGVSAARNAGVAESSGEVIAFLDADDLMKPDRLERQLAVLAGPPSVDFVLGSPELRVEDGVEPPGVMPAGPIPGRERYHAMATLMRRETLDRIGPFDTSMAFGEDGDWLMRAFESGLPYGEVGEPVVVRRLHGGNVSYDAASSRRGSFEILRRRAQRHRARKAAGPG